MTEQERPPAIVTATPRAVVSVIDADRQSGETVAAVAKSIDVTCRVYSSAETFLASSKDEAGCSVISVRLPGLSGLELQQELNRLPLAAPVLMIGAQPAISQVVFAMEQGAMTFLEKPLDVATLADRLRRAIAIDRQNRERNQRLVAIRQRYDRLTPKEHEVVSRVLNGLTNRAIAAELGVSVRAVEDRRSRIMRRMEADSLVELVDLIREVERSTRD